MPVLSDELQYVKPYEKHDILDIIEEIKPFFVHCSARGL